MTNREEIKEKIVKIINDNGMSVVIDYSFINYLADYFIAEQRKLLEKIKQKIDSLSDACGNVNWEEDNYDAGKLKSIVDSVGIIDQKFKELEQ